MIVGRTRAGWVALLLLATAAPVAAGSNASITVAPTSAAAVRPLPVSVSGRVRQSGTPASPSYERQWPGGYFETAFTGTDAYLRIGPGKVSLRILVDDRPVARMVKPQPGLYAVRGLTAGAHRLRVQIVSESQAGPSSFLGFYAGSRTTALPIDRRARQIEFIGDSHTVGYGNTADTRDCSQDQVWATTDTSQGIAGIAATRYHADYQVNAISGRGVVRNYDGTTADTLPEAYPFVLFDKAAHYADPAWQPQVIVVALGTNDFTTPLHAGERWQDRAALHADFETTYTGFIQRLRAQHPRAFLILWATDLADGEIISEARKVVNGLRAGGEQRIAFVPVAGLALSACHGHPSVADDRTIADAIGQVIDARANVWQGEPG